ncbi:MAG: leucyl/phenylalanyl-tRNA--protein transferase [Treponemataceae bacterium]
MADSAREAVPFPFFGERDRYRFPDPRKADEHGVVGVGGNLSPGMLLSAYEQGIFPWFSEEDPIVWWSPDPRFVLFPESLHVSESMRKVLKKGVFRIETDRCFREVIRSCSLAPRPGQDGTWITEDMINAYSTLHDLGWVHSAEAYRDGRLVGGCYGIRIGRAFFGESMFTVEPNASKAAFITLARRLFEDGVVFVDCQVPTDHLRSLGAGEIPRADFLDALSKALGDSLSDAASRRGKWHPGGVFSL